MPDAKINDTCIIGLPTCGYAFSSARMAFIGAPGDGSAALELNVLEAALREREYEAYIALQRNDPGKFAFCTKICSKIITSQFCIVLLNESQHATHTSVRIPNPNVHLEYGLMMAFKKHIIPFQREGDALAFNIQPLDTLLYTAATFREKAERAIDDAIARVGTPARPTRALASNQTVIRYMAVRGVTFTDVTYPYGAYWYRMGQGMGFNLLDSPMTILYFGFFDQESPKEIAFRLKMLLQSLHNAKTTFEAGPARSLPDEDVARNRGLWGSVAVEVLVAEECDRPRLESRVRELTADLTQFSWRLLSQSEIQRTVDVELGSIGDL